MVIRGKVAAERTITANTLREAVAAGTMTAQTISVSYLSGTTPNRRTYVGVPLHEVMMDFTEPLFGTTIRNIGLRYFLAVSAVDNYRVLMAWGDIDPFFGNRQDILLAYDERNDDTGQAGFTSLADVGPRLIVPGDIRGGRYVSCVRDIRLASADDSDGVVPAPTPTATPIPQPAPGPTGQAGAPGKAGTDGKAGRGAGPSCTLSSRTVRCEALLVPGAAKARLTRRGKTVARGTMRKLTASTTLSRGGGYTLRLNRGGSAPVVLE